MMKQLLLIKQSLLFVSALVFIGCGVYTFQGSSLPSYLKTVDIPLFINSSLQSGIAEVITVELQNNVQENRILETVPDNGDATINGKVLSYKNHPYIYGSQANRQVEVSSYSVTISVEVEFLDNQKDKPLYKGVITEDGVYNFETETEEDGRSRAIKKIIERIMQNSVQGW